MDRGRIELPVSDQPRASIVVVSSVNAAGLERSLRSVAALARDGVPFEAVVVLNGAEADVRARVYERVAGVKVVDSEVNRGFAGGSNLGRAAASGEFVVLLHDDAEPQDGWLAALVRCADEYPEAGAVGSRVLYPDGRLQSAGWVLWRNGETRAIGLRASVHEDLFLERRPIDFANSSSVLVRAKTWDAVGGLDERFHPAYYADVDLGMAIRSIGSLVLYEPSARVFHRMRASSSADAKARFMARNRELFCQKWASRLQSHADRGEDAEAFSRAFERARREAESIRTAAGQDPRGDLDAPRAAVDAELALLRRRVEELEEIENGGWWRLRARVLPLINLSHRVRARVRRRVSRRAAASRTG